MVVFFQWPAGGDFLGKIRQMGQKNTLFEKQSGEVAENKGKGYMDSQKQTGKQSGEVVENTCLWKKQTGTNRKTKRAMLLKTNGGRKADPKTNRSFSWG